MLHGEEFYAEERAFKLFKSAAKAVRILKAKGKLALRKHVRPKVTSIKSSLLDRKMRKRVGSARWKKMKEQRVDLTRDRIKKKLWKDSGYSKKYGTGVVDAANKANRVGSIGRAKVRKAALKARNAPIRRAKRWIDKKVSGALEVAGNVAYHPATRPAAALGAIGVYSAGFGVLGHHIGKERAKETAKRLGRKQNVKKKAKGHAIFGAITGMPGLAISEVVHAKRKAKTAEMRKKYGPAKAKFKGASGWWVSSRGRRIFIKER